jgi:hypothetical protein
MWITMKAFPKTQSGSYQAVVHDLSHGIQHEHHIHEDGLERVSLIWKIDTERLH